MNKAKLVFVHGVFRWTEKTWQVCDIGDQEEIQSVSTLYAYRCACIFRGPNSCYALDTEISKQIVVSAPNARSRRTY
jgi:hypothetical protein